MKDLSRILVVDDDEVNCDIVAKHLRDEYDVRSANSGEGLFEVLKTFEPDLILLDVMMPGMNGYEACRLLKEDPKTAEIPVMFLTAATGETVKGFAVGAVDFISKPMRASELRARIRNQLKLQSALRELADANAKLLEVQTEMSSKIRERTEALERMNQTLQAQMHEKSLVEERLRFLATHDRITRLPSYESFHNTLEGHVLRANRDNTPHTFMRLDLFSVEYVNENYGLKDGQDLLAMVADVLRHSLPMHCHIGRIGGSRYGISAPQTGIDEARRMVGKVLEKVRAPGFFVREGKNVLLKITCALVDTHAGIRSSDHAFSCADRAARKAKESDEGIAEYHQNSERSIEIARVATWAEKLQGTIDSKQFALFYQRIEALQGTEAAHIEVLIRMKEGEQYVLPAAFLPMVERLKLAPKLDLWVVDQVLEWLASPIAAVWGLAKVAINLSGQSLNDAAFVETLLERVQRSGELAKSLCFELTEQIAIVNLGGVSETIAQLRKLGATVALDDFGAGFSSYGYLKSLPADYLKIDGQFVRDLINDPVSLALVKSMNDVGHATGKKTIAEYVENDEIRALLKDIGIDYAQGYGVHVPEPLPLFE